MIETIQNMLPLGLGLILMIAVLVAVDKRLPKAAKVRKPPTGATITSIEAKVIEWSGHYEVSHRYPHFDAGWQIRLRAHGHYTMGDHPFNATFSILLRSQAQPYDGQEGLGSAKPKSVASSPEVWDIQLNLGGREVAEILDGLRASDETKLLMLGWLANGTMNIGNLFVDFPSSTSSARLP